MRRYITVVLLLMASLVSQAQTRELADSLIEYGSAYLGKPYRRAGNGPSAFDCSGFTRFVYGHFGIDLPHSSAEQGKVGRPVDGDISQMQKGDLVLFSGSKVSNTIGHVGIFIGPDPSGESFSFIHAAIHGGVIVSHSNEDYYARRFRAVRRVLPDFVQGPEQETSQEPEEDIREGGVIEPDRLALSEGDMRIVMFADGKWSFVDAGGVLRKPSDDSVIVLSPDGSWRVDKHVAEEAPEYYIVKSGDTLYKISQRLGTTISSLCELNDIKQTTTLHIGQRLRVK